MENFNFIPRVESKERLEKIPTKEEVLEIISRNIENPNVTRELSDEQGLYLLETEKTDEDTGEVTQYQYMRKGRFPSGNESSQTAIYVNYYDKDGIPLGGDKIAVYDSEVGEWKEIK